MKSLGINKILRILNIIILEGDYEPFLQFKSVVNGTVTYECIFHINGQKFIYELSIETNELILVSTIFINEFIDLLKNIPPTNINLTIFKVETNEIEISPSDLEDEILQILKI